MRKRILDRIRNFSKRGFSLPMAVATSLFLVIISTTLIFIAVQSNSTTSADISGRQAYLNVRSALEYAQTYYSNNVTDYSTVGTEYMLMLDQGGTTEGGARISKNASDTAKYRCYVIAAYQKAENSNPATLKLSAYCKYSDAFGNKAKVAHLSVTFTVGSSGPNRLTIITTDRTGESAATPDNITLNVKKPVGMDYQLTYYVWTYEDVGHAYDDYNEEAGDISYLYDTTIQSKGLVGALNTTTQSKSILPNAEWRLANDDAKKLLRGPNGIMADMGNGWFAGEYFIKDGRVPWFNIIFAQQGSILNPSNKDGKSAWNIYNSQVNEIFHLWYLDPSDRNIYFEFFDTKKTETGKGYPNEVNGTAYYTKYCEGSGWNGRDGLEDTVLVYVKNPKTTLHFRMSGIDDTNVKTSLTAAQQPVITSVESNGNPITGQSYLHSGNKETSNIKMTYEGCGWWAANVETSESFNVTISFNGISMTARNIDANSVSNEFWLVYRLEGGSTNTLNVHTSETTALYDLGIDPNSYVTVHAKVADYTKSATPKIGFGDVGLNSSTGRVNLLQTLLDAIQVHKADYTPESYAVLEAAITEGFEKINNDKFIENQEGATAAEKIAKADASYNETREKILTAVDNLKSKKASPELINSLNALIRKGQQAVERQNKNGYYDINEFRRFVGEIDGPSAYQQATEAIKNPDALTITEINTHKTNLTAALDTLNKSILDRNTLYNYIEDVKSLENSKDYDAAYLQDFKEKLTAARTAVALKETSQGALDLALHNLQVSHSELVQHTKSVLDISRLNTLKGEALAKLPASVDGERINCTDETYNTLVDVFNRASNIGSITKQEDIDKLADELKEAIDNYTVVKPSVTNDKLLSEKQIRVWIKIDPANMNFMLSQYPVGSDTATILASASMHETAANSGLYYIDISREQFDRVVFKVTNSQGTIVDSPEVKFDAIADNNVIISVDAQGNSVIGKMVTVYGTFKGDVHKGKIGTVTVDSSFEENVDVFRYIITEENKDQNFTVVGLTSHFEGEKEVVSQITYQIGKLEAGEYVVTYKAADDEKLSTDTNCSISCKPVKAEDIYPKYNKPVTPVGDDSEPDAEGVLATDDIAFLNLATDGEYIYFTDSEWGGIYWGDDARACFYDNSGKEVGTKWPGYQLTYYKTDSNHDKMYKVKPPAGATKVIFNNIIDGQWKEKQQSDTISFSLGTGYAKGSWIKDDAYGNKVFAVTSWTESTVVTDDTVQYENDYIYITNSLNWKGLHIYFFGTKTVGADWPGYLLEFDKNNSMNQAIYKIKPPKGATKFVVNNTDGGAKSTDTSFTLGDGYYVSTEMDGPLYKMKGWDSNKGGDGSGGDSGGGGSDGGSGGGGGGTYNNPGINEDDLADVDLPMAYVGGGKVRIQNKSYADIYGEGGKKNSSGYDIGAGNRFGGTGGAGGNNDSDGRLGMAELSAYYDWYEFKLPVSKEADYTFGLTGMDPAHPTVQTKTVKNAHGDVWLEQLSNYNGGSGHFTNFNLYTFDPEEVQIGDTLSVYFRLPDGWTDPTITVSGPFLDPAPVPMTKQLTRAENANIYYLDNISRNTPFITFTVKEPKAGASTTHVYKTSLQGGDYCLFEPTNNDNYGEWVKFESDQMALKKAINLLRSVYYGYNIVSQYDDKGELATGANRVYSEGLLNMYSAYSTKVETSGLTYYITTNVDSKTEQEAYNDLISLNSKLNLYRALYHSILSSRQYIDDPLKDSDMSSHKIHGDGGGHYPEYFTKGAKNRQYSASSLASLRKKLANAEEVFLSDSSATELENAIADLQRGVSGLEISSEGSIACVLFDAQAKVRAGSTFKIRYTLAENSTDYKYTNVKDYNPERYPIIFLTSDETGAAQKTDAATGNKYIEIFNVQFVEYPAVGDMVELGKAKPVMRTDEAWVFVDTKSNPYWSQNTATDYREINADIFVQSSDTDDQSYHMKKSGTDSYKSMTLLFTKDAEVRTKSYGTYTIKAGSYFFDSDMTKATDSPVKGGTLDLFSESAKTYFSDQTNWGEYIVGQKNLSDNEIKSVKDAAGLWHDGNTFVTGTNNVTGSYINLEASKGELTTFAPYYSYSTTDGLCFRWSTEDPLYTSTKVKLYASEYKFAFMGTLDGTKKGTRNPQFLLYCSDTNANSMKVEFRTDVYVKYYDNMGILHSFAIREGIYIIEKSDDTSSYIANLYDETYWKSMEHVTFIGRGTADDPGIGSSGRLQNGNYSD